MAPPTGMYPKVQDAEKLPNPPTLAKASSLSSDRNEAKPLGFAPPPQHFLAAFLTLKSWKGAAGCQAPCKPKIMARGFYLTW